MPDEAPTAGYGQAYPGPGYAGQPHTAPAWAPAPGGGGGSRGMVWAVVGVVVVVLVAGAVGAVLLTRGSDPGGTVTAATPSTAGATAPATASAPVPAGCANAAGTPSDPAPLGQGAVIGPFCVAITRAVQDATAMVLAENSANTPPVNGRYLLLDISALNPGPSSEDAFFSLYVTLRTPDGTTYEDTDCSEALPNDLSQQPKAAPGDTTTGAL